MRRVSGGLAVVLAAAIAATSAGASRSRSECLSFGGRELEVCTAYVVNATFAARVPYYALGRSENAARARLARYRFESRYVGAARRKLEGAVARWPRGAHVVRVPRIEIVALSVDAARGRAVLHTRESWHVTTRAGRTLFAEDRRPHVVRIQRVEGLALHKWVVAALS